MPEDRDASDRASEANAAPRLRRLYAGAAVRRDVASSKVVNRAYS